MTGKAVPEEARTGKVELKRMKPGADISVTRFPLWPPSAKVSSLSSDGLQMMAWISLNDALYIRQSPCISPLNVDLPSFSRISSRICTKNAFA
ncbi:hypothetical protein JAU75_14940 [Ochrobactrum sp. Q0168]|uniref:hypothetical protein n=1 Tax=Ochrobactrum sp. Q0168 TaxID=2793241 RepID=UPI0018EAF6CD|nr:hypothetical protein [Ochrobactrum sp. Q0168]